MAISRTKNGGKQSFNAPFSASHLEKTRTSASDFASQSRTNESHQSSAAATQNVCRTARDSTAATQNVCRTAGHLPLVYLGIHPGHYRRMSGGNSYVFEISGGNSHTIQQVPSRKCTRIRHSFSDEKNRQSSRSTQASGRQLTAANSRQASRSTRRGTGHHKAHEYLPAARHRAECRMHRRSEASQQMTGRSLSPPGASATRTPSPHGEAQDSK